VKDDPPLLCLHLAVPLDRRIAFRNCDAERSEIVRSPGEGAGRMIACDSIVNNKLMPIPPNSGLPQLEINVFHVSR